VTLAVLLAVGLVFYVPILLKFFRYSFVAGSINVVQGLLQFLSLCLLFTNFESRLVQGKSVDRLVVGSSYRRRRVTRRYAPRPGRTFFADGRRGR